MDSLVIKLEQVYAPREPYRRTLGRPFMDEVFAEASGWSAKGPAEFVGYVTKLAGSAALLEGEAEVGVVSRCRRCLREVETTLPVEFTLNLVTRRDDRGYPGGGAGEDDGESEKAGTFDGEADEEYFDGEVIQLRPILREQILLALPAIEPVCREECKGLCVVCGHDLNEKDCGHLQKPADPRWSALRDLKL